MNRKVLWSILILLVLAGGFLGLVIWLGPEPIGPAGFRRLQPGMARAEMGRILGPEASPERMHRRHFGSTIWLAEKQWGTLGWVPPLDQWACWENSCYVIEVIFDAHDQALTASLYKVPGARLTFWQRVRAWL